MTVRYGPVMQYEVTYAMTGSTQTEAESIEEAEAIVRQRLPIALLGGEEVRVTAMCVAE